ncbi:hypothetical protein Y032_0242g3405 [Ancylostoma ceylanicum]|nr:hypothetical protein Y032_0242g3405 [Ancylostoma ceylanicum]
MISQKVLPWDRCEKCLEKDGYARQRESSVVDNIKLDEALIRLNEMRSEMITHKQIIGLLTEILTTTKTILEIQASAERSADGLQYSYVSREMVESLQKYRRGSINQFALDSEKEVHKGKPGELEVHKGKPGELLLRVRDRLETASRTEFIEKIKTRKGLDRAPAHWSRLCTLPCDSSFHCGMKPLVQLAEDFEILGQRIPYFSGFLTFFWNLSYIFVLSSPNMFR